MIRCTASRSAAGALLALVAVAAAGRADAAELRLELDPGATRITFELGATLHTVEGTARLREGRIVFDPASGEAGGRIAVAAASLDTGHEGRDQKMHAKVLESASFPEIVFEPTSVFGELGSESRLTVDGTFSVHGERHPLSLEVVVQLDGESLTATAEFEVPYVAWGMKDPSRLVMRVAKEVRVRIEAAGSLTATGGPAAGDEAPGEGDGA